MSLLKCNYRLCFTPVRSVFKPPSNLPYAGIYRKDGDIVMKNDLLVVQRRMNYHPGLNVHHEKDFGGQHQLIANCEGTVMITREKAEVDRTLYLMIKEYKYRNFENLYKLTFSVVPRKMSNTFELVGEV